MATGEEILESIERVLANLAPLKIDCEMIIINHLLPGIHEVTDGDKKYIFMDKASLIRLEHFARMHYQYIKDEDDVYLETRIMGIPVVEDDELAKEILMRVFGVDLSWPKRNFVYVFPWKRGNNGYFVSNMET